MGKLKLLGITVLSICVLLSSLIPVSAQETTETGGNNTGAMNTGTSSSCNGIKLNTNFPIVGNCISYDRNRTNPTNVFQEMMGALTKIIGSVILVVCFIMIIIAGIMRAGAGEDSSQRTKAKKLIEKVAITILLIGFSGAILRLINPNFFG